MKWNNEQLKAITTRNHNILVSASAGSGKTTVLVERLIRRILEDNVPLSSILAMTYTDAAAGEMKKRLAKKLQEKLDETSDEESKIYIQEQLSLLPDANISTIHSFCLSIVKKFYYVTNLDATQVNTILDGATLQMDMERAINVVLKQYLEAKDPLFITLCELFSPRAENFDSLKQAIFTLSNAADSTADREAYFQKSLAFYEDCDAIASLHPTLKACFFDYLLSSMHIYEDQIKELKQHFLDGNGKEAKLSLFEEKLMQIQKLVALLKEEQYTTFHSELCFCVKVMLPPNPNKEDKEYDHIRKSIQTLEDDLLAQLLPEQNFLNQIKELRPIIALLIEMTKTYQETFTSYKRARKGIDFYDMEAYAISILKENPDIAKYYQDLFEEIMVDEFQDANEVQNVLVQLIARDHNVFRVGDIKQSIYGFRHAKPSIMRDLIVNQKEQDMVIYLSNNYRSKQSLIDFNNALYQELMNTSDFTPAFHKEDFALGGTEAQQQDTKPICFHELLLKDMEESLPYKMSGPSLKAQFIAKQIIEMKEKQQLNWKDFVVLARSNSVKEEMKKAFKACQIPFFIDAKSGFYTSSAVSIVLSYLRACINPYNNIAMLAILASPLFQVSYEDLAQAKIAMREQKEYSYFNYYVKKDPSLLETFLQHQKQIHQLSLKQLLNEIYAYHEFYHSHTNMQDKTNLDLLYEMACDYESKHGIGISGFVRYIEQIKEQESAEALPIGAEADVVRVMSIHQSKGLQFPVVFLWSTATFSSKESSDMMICDNELGIGMYHLSLPYRYRQNTLLRIAMEHKKNKEALEEEMRILYVATTRAQNEMHIVDAITDVHKLSRSHISSPLIYQKKGYTSWLNSASTIPKGLFYFDYVMKYWNQETTSKKTKKLPVPIKKYTYDVDVMTYTTPTASKNETITLQLHNTGMKYGTTLHAYVEALGALPWTSNHIQEVSKQEELDYSETIENALLQLSQNKQFIYFHTMQTYYEVPFSTKVKDTLLHGTMDFVSMNDEEIHIVDFKSDYVDDISILHTRYQKQLQAYQEAMHILYPNQKVFTYLYSFHLHEMSELK